MLPECSVQPPATRRGRVACFFLCVGSVFWIAAWVTNVDVALRFVFGRELRLRSVLPRVVYDLLATFAVDHSTVSTMLPAFLFAIPAALGWWLLRGKPLPRWVEAARAPFPSWFATRCIDAGMFGTLVGMCFGLPSDALQDVPKALALLVAGFKTAVVSSIVGMLVPCLAFVLAPVFRWCFGITIQPASGSAVIAELRESLVDLTSAASAAKAQLGSLGSALNSQWLAELKHDIGEMRQLQQRSCDLLSKAVQQYEATASTQAQQHDELVALLKKLARKSSVRRDRVWRVLGGVCDSLGTVNGKPPSKRTRHA